ncbi:MAG: hypothetical protein HZA47_07645 [Planctomycetes bacterium]|nr:hypothetical protein [Planctomycetota bacterium]
MESSWQVFTGISTAAVAIAIITFLWKRRGRLWIFYYSIISKSIEQFKTDSLDFVKWEEIAFQNCDLLVKDLSGSLFRFEIEYLRKIIIGNKYLLCIGDSSTTATVEKVKDDPLKLKRVENSRKIIDHEKYCIHSLKKTYFGDFRFCGIGLFLKSIWYQLWKDKDKGYTETKSETWDK